MSYTLVIKEEAAKETIESYLWYETRVEGLGESFLEELDDCYSTQRFYKILKHFRNNTNHFGKLT